MTQAMLLESIAQAVHNLAPEGTAQAVRAALAAGIAPVPILDLGIATGMERVGEDYQQQQAFLPELLMAEQCMRSGLSEIESFAGAAGVQWAAEARARLVERAASWLPALSSCVNRLLHSSDSLLVNR